MSGDDGNRAGESAVTVRVDEGIYSRECILNACYWFSDRYDFSVSRADAGAYAVRIRRKVRGAELGSVAREFENALIDHQLRADIRKETESIRELILAKAFAEGELLADPPAGDDRDPVEVAGRKANSHKSG